MITAGHRAKPGPARGEVMRSPRPEGLGAWTGAVTRSALPPGHSLCLIGLLALLDASGRGRVTSDAIEERTRFSTRALRRHLGDLVRWQIVRRTGEPGGGWLYEVDDVQLAAWRPDPAELGRGGQIGRSGHDVRSGQNDQERPDWPERPESAGGGGQIRQGGAANLAAGTRNRSARSCLVAALELPHTHHADTREPGPEVDDGGGELIVEPDPELQQVSRLEEIVEATTRASRDQVEPSPGEVDLLRAVERERGAEWCLRTLRTVCAGAERPATMLASQARASPRASPEARDRRCGRPAAAEEYRSVGRHSGPVEVSPDELAQLEASARETESWPECPGCRGRGCGQCGGTGRVSPAAVARGEVPGLELCRFCDNGRIGESVCKVCNGGRVLTVEVAL